MAVAVLYAVNGGSGRKRDVAALQSTNPAPAVPPVPAQPSPMPLLPPATGAVASVANDSGPKIAFETPIYDFGRIKSGETVKHTYVFTNVGGALLEVSNVVVSCGCTTAGDWTRQVEPGKTGAIPIHFNSANFGGPVGKSVTVMCNDTNQPSVLLQIKGNVWKPIDVLPQFAMLTVTTEAPSNATTVRIVNNEEAPLDVFSPQCSNPALATELKTNQPGKEFELVVKTVPPLPAGDLHAQITLKTSSTNLPVLLVSAWVNVQQAVTVMPTQIILPTGPLPNSMPFTVTIRNNATNALAVTEPTLNAKGVDLQLMEFQRGRLFSLTMNFPAGFEIAQGEKVELSVKSDHPQFPTIKVPVIQPPRLGPPIVPMTTPSAPSSPSH